MNVTYISKKLQKLCNSEDELRSQYGDRMAAKIMSRLADLDGAESLMVMRLLPGRCHELTGDRAGELAVDLVHPNRLVFRPDHDPVPRNESGMLLWDKVTKIVIVEIVDYHN